MSEVGAELVTLHAYGRLELVELVGVVGTGPLAGHDVLTEDNCVLQELSLGAGVLLAVGVH